MSIVVVGSLHMDVMVQAPGRPRLGETMVGTGWSLRPGGKGGNQAVAAARHGARVAMIGAVGDDDFGTRLRANLIAGNVDAGGVTVRTEAGSGMSVALVEPSGDYGAVIVSGVNLLLDAQALQSSQAELRDAACLVMQNEVPDAANLAASRIARAGGARVILNAAPARALPAPLLELLDILVVNALEAEALCGVEVTGLAAAMQAARMLARTVPCAIVTAGGSGVAVAQRDGREESIEPVPVTVVSTHGAGDMFVGALAARLAHGDGIADAARHANRAAADLVAAPRDDAR